MNEVWSGILDRRQAVELPDGHYLLEVTGVEGLKRQSFELRSEAKSIAIATEQSSGRSRGADFADGIAEERGGVVGKVSGLEMKSPSTPTIRHSLQRAVSKRTSTRGDYRLASAHRGAVDGNKASILIALWSKSSDTRWQLNREPTLDQLLAPSSRQRI